MNLKLKPDGTVESIGNPLGLPFARGARKRRLSTITPWLAPIKGPAFRILRLVFGDDGRVAAWTRTWRGPWIVRILATGEWTVREKRADCIDWEIEQLSGPKFDL